MKAYRLSALGVVALALALAATTANAQHWCSGGGTVVAVGEPVTGVAYVAVDCVMSCGFWLFSVWIYAESNGERGLQRGGVTLLGDTDWCQDSASPDQGIF